MKKLFFLPALVFVMTTAFTPQRAVCAWCPDFECFESAICGPECFCMKREYEMGVCISYNMIEEYEKQGYVRAD